jgi:hypothetical protein
MADLIAGRSPLGRGRSELSEDSDEVAGIPIGDYARAR